MKRLTFYIFIILTAFTYQLSAAEFKSSETLIISESDSLNEDLFYGGKYLEISGNLQGDIIVGSQKSNFNGQISDDVYAWSEEIRVNGEIGDMFIGFAKDIIIKGKIEGDVIAYGGSVHILKGAEIFGNLYVGTGYLYIDNAIIHGSVNGGGGRINLNGTFEKDIKLAMHEIIFGDDFKSNGKVEITLDKKPVDEILNAPKNMQLKIEKISYFFSTFSFYWFFISALVIGFILLAILPGMFQNMSTLNKTRFLSIAGSGALFIILMPVAAIFGVLFLPLTFILIALFVIILYLSKIFAAYVTVDYLLEKIQPGKQMNKYLKLFLGLLILTLLVKIPVLGGFVWLAAAILGSGVFVYNLFMMRKTQAE